VVKIIYFNKLMEYKKIIPFKNRKNECDRIRAKYPDRIPVIVERSMFSKELNEIDKKKFLIPADLTVGQFVYVIRRRITLSSDKALFIFINDDLMPSSSELLSVIWKNYKEKDGYLYVKYSGENTFG
tara:strand:+ start:143 stop:523 length:381 start_codon:yes stop_codon:yes gene_type:complete